MRLSCLRIIAVIMCFVLMVSCFSGCIFRLFGADEEEDNTKYFEDYNTLEVNISDDEKFILLFSQKSIDSLRNEKYDDDEMSGYGEWVKDGVAKPIYFFKKYYWFGDQKTIEIFYDFKKDFNIEKDNMQNNYVIALLSNSENGLVVEWQADIENVKRGDTVPVTVSTVNRDLNEKWSYISEAWTEFASVDREKGTRFVCNEQNFFYDAGLCEGEWNVNGTKIPIRIEFKEDRPCMEIYDTRYDTRGDRLILTAEGYEIIDENTIKFNNLTGNMFYSDTVKSITIIKENYLTGEELTDGES